MRLTFTSNNGVNYASATLPGGIVKSFVQDSDGTYIASNVRAFLTVSNVNGETQYTVSDPSNTKVVFDANGYIKFIEDNKGNRLHFETNSDNGNIVRMYDSTGVNVIFTYDSQTGKLVEISDISIINAPITASFNYDSNGRLISSTNMNGITMRYEYKAVEEDEAPSYYISAFKNNWNQIIESIEYIDDYGIVHTVTNARGVVYTYNYGNEKRFYSSITDTNGRTTGQSYDASRKVTSSTNTLGERVRVFYALDENGINRYSEVESYVDERGNTTTYTRDANGNVTQITYPNDSKEYYTYDTNNNVTKHIDRDGKTTFYVYNGNLLTTVAVRLAGDKNYGEAGYNEDNFSITSYTYYAVNQVVNGITVKINGLVATETGPLGNVISYTYDARGRVLTQTYGSGASAYSVAYSYNHRGSIITETDSNGVVTTYTYNSNGFLTQKSVNDPNDSEPARVIATYVYDNLGRKVQEQDAQQYFQNVSIRYTYNTAGDIETKTLYVSPTESYTTGYTYDSYGNVISETLPNGSYSIYTYDELNRKKNTYFYDNTTQKTTLLQSITYANSGKNLIVTTTEHTGENFTATTVESYDFENNLISKIIRNGSISYAEYIYTYTPGGKLLTETDPAGNETSYTYDITGNVTQIETPFDGTNKSRIYRTYDKIGNMISERIVNNIPDDENETTTRTDYRYDVWGNLITVIMYDENQVVSVVRYVYNNKNQLIAEFKGLSSLNTEVTTNYAMTSGRAALGYSMTTHTYNAFGEMIGTIDPMGYTESYDYYSSGELHSYTDKKGSITTYIYDKFGNVSSEFVVKANAETISKTFTYDSVGNLTALTQTIGNGTTQTTFYTYDGYGNMLTETYNAITKTYTYDRAGNLLSAEITRVEEGSPVQLKCTVYTYDWLGRLYTVSDGATLKATYTYDNMSRLLTTVHSNGVTETNAYNDAGLTTSVVNTDPEGMVISWYTYEYSLDGNQISKTDQNGRTEYTYDDLNRLIRVTYFDQSYDAYTYDANGNRVAKWFISQYEQICEDYTYDNNDRFLETEILNVRSVTYSYDANGNMVEKQIVEPQQVPQEILQRVGEGDGEDEEPPIITVVTQDFDLLNRMTGWTDGTTTAEYTYYPNNQRKSKVVTTCDTSQEMSLMAAEPPGTTTTTHIWTGDEIQVDKIVKNYYIIEVTESEDGELIEESVLVTETNTVNYLHGLKLIESNYGTYLYNAHGDVTAIVGMIEPQLGGDEVFGIIASYDYDPFGMPPVARSLIRDIDMADEIMNGFGGNQLMGRAGDDAAGLRINRADDNNPFRYCGEYLDIETGYIYLRARYYDPSIGRFISVDSAKDGANWYVYCANNPIAYVDPSELGQAPCCFGCLFLFLLYQTRFELIMNLSFYCNLIDQSPNKRFVVFGGGMLGF